MKNFQVFIGIDWSGAKTPKNSPAIAVSSCEQGNSAPVLHTGPWSRTRISEYIESLANSSDRILIGIDANFGYAQEVGIAQFGHNYDHQTLWKAVEHSSLDHDNFFAAGFWQAWPDYFWTKGKQPEHMTLPKRATEIACVDAGLGHPESPFKLIGAKQVGKGGLAAMRMAWHLKQKLGDKLCIWPFEPDLTDSADIVITEIYPRQFLKRTGHGNKKIKTIDQLNDSLVSLGSEPYPKGSDSQLPLITDHDTDALVSAAGLRKLCGTDGLISNRLAHPKGLTSDKAKREGWIFGVGYTC